MSEGTEEGDSLITIIIVFLFVAFVMTLFLVIVVLIFAKEGTSNSYTRTNDILVPSFFPLFFVIKDEINCWIRRKDE